jgi:hypothetical protein
MALDGITRREGVARVFDRVGIRGSAAYGHLYLKPLAAAPSAATDAEGRISYVENIGLVVNDGADWVTPGGLTIVTFHLVPTTLDTIFFVADRDYTVTGVREVHSTASSGITLGVRKILAASASAPGAALGANVLNLLATTSTIDMNAAIDVVQTPTLHATASNLQLTAGDKLAADFSGALTAGTMGVLEVLLQQR